MKKLLTIVSGFLLGGSLFAMPVLNIADPVLIPESVFLCNFPDVGVKFGYRGDFVYDRNLDDVDHGHIKRFKFFANEGVLTVNFFQRVDIYGFMGSASYNYEGFLPDNAIVPTTGNIIAASRGRTIYGGGIKAIIWECDWGVVGRSYIGFDIQYEGMSRSLFDRATIQGVDVATNNVGYNYRETQVALGFAQKIYNFVPYVAVKWSRAYAHVGSNTTIGSGTGTSSAATFGNLRSHKPAGYVVGTSYAVDNKIYVTGEARFQDEKALSIAAMFKF